LHYTEDIFSAPHGSVSNTGHLLDPEYDISILTPYMKTIELFSNYYNTYVKYVNILESIKTENLSQSSFSSSTSTLFGNKESKLSTHSSSISNESSSCSNISFNLFLKSSILLITAFSSIILFGLNKEEHYWGLDYMKNKVFKKNDSRK
jgi:hypothetical protein